MLRLTRPKVLFCDADVVATVRRAIEDLLMLGKGEIALYTVDRNVDGTKSAEDLTADKSNMDADAERDFVPTAVGPDCTRHPVAIVCSSGTTGASKGVAISHTLLLNQLTGIW